MFGIFREAACRYIYKGHADAIGSEVRPLEETDFYFCVVIGQQLSTNPILGGQLSIRQVSKVVFLGFICHLTVYCQEKYTGIVNGNNNFRQAMCKSVNFRKILVPRESFNRKVPRYFW